MAAATAMRRPDDRTFLSIVGDDLDAHLILAEAAHRSLGVPVHLGVDGAAVDRLAAYGAAGFDVEITSERFRLRFDAVLDRVRRARVPPGITTSSAAEVDEGRLFRLDNAIRNDVPGTDGWRGNRDWFRDELATSPPFDASAYLVAIDDRNGDYVGLVRIWRNPGGPRFGLVGVVRSHRHSPIAAALLKQALEAAAAWGHPTFVTETSLSNGVIYPRMERVGAESLGRFHQLVLR